MARQHSPEIELQLAVHDFRHGGRARLEQAVAGIDAGKLSPVQRQLYDAAARALAAVPADRALAVDALGDILAVATAESAGPRPAVPPSYPPPSSRRPAPAVRPAETRGKRQRKPGRFRWQDRADLA